MSETPTPSIDLASYLKVDQDNHAAHCQALAKLWVERMLNDAGVSLDGLEGAVTPEEYTLAVHVCGAELYNWRRSLTSGQGSPEQAETIPVSVRHDARAAARDVLRDYVGWGIA